MKNTTPILWLTVVFCLSLAIAGGAFMARHPALVDSLADVAKAGARLRARVTYRAIERFAFNQPMPRLNSAIHMQTPEVMPDVPLTIGHIDHFSMRDLRGSYVLLFFGSAECLSTCPDVLAQFVAVKQALGRMASRVRFVMVGVDVEHDSPTTLLQHVRAYDPTFLALTGSAITILPFATKHGIWVTTHARGRASPFTRYSANALYSMFIAPDGRWTTSFPLTLDAADIADEMRVEMGVLPAD